jgi:hypothetical protein
MLKEIVSAMTALVGVVGYMLNSGSDSRISHTQKQESGYIHSIGNQTVKEEDERRRTILEASTATRLSTGGKSFVGHWIVTIYSLCLDEIKIELRDVFVR